MEEPPWLLAIVVAYVPALLWLVYFYRKDRYEPEPTRAVLIFFLMGSILAVPAAIALGFVTVPLVGDLGIDDTGVIGFFIVMVLLAGLPEEAIKGGLAAFRARREKDVDEPADPMIYFTSLGLGFGALETVLYIVGTWAEVIPIGSSSAISAAAEVAIIRALTVTAGHGVWTGITGLFYSRRRFGGAQPAGLLVGILVAATLHALYNTAVSYDLLLGVAVLLVSGLWWGLEFKRALARSPFGGAAVVAPPSGEPPAASPPAPPPQP